MINILVEKLKNHFINYTTPVINNSEKRLAFWREKVLLNVIYILFFTAIIAYIPSVYLGVVNEIWTIVIVDTVVYALLFYLYSNKKLSVKFRAYSILSFSYVLGVMLILVVGPLGAGYLWLFVIPILCGTLIERKSAVIFVIINLFTLIVLGFIQHYIHPTAAEKFLFNPSSWFVISANFIFLNIILTFSISVLIRGLQETLVKEEEMIASLEKKNVAVETARVEAENANKLKSEFLAQMSHEIRTPINTILSFSSLIRSELESKVDESMNEYFSSMSNAGKRIIRTIDLILNMSEIQTESFKPIKRTINLCYEIFDNLIDEYKVLADEKGLKLTLNNTSGFCSVDADEYTLNQIFANLIDNAIKYTEKGEVNINIYNSESNLIICVCDTGIGISEEYLGQLFTPFSQEDNGYSRRFEGNGLGLSLVKKYCELNDADIKTESKKGFGTKVKVVFPLK